MTAGSDTDPAGNHNTYREQILEGRYRGLDSVLTSPKPKAKITDKFDERKEFAFQQTVLPQYENSRAKS